MSKKVSNDIKKDVECILRGEKSYGKEGAPVSKRSEIRSRSEEV